MATEPRARLYGAAQAVLAAVAIATSAPLAKSIVGLTPTAVASARCLVAAVVLGAFFPRLCARSVRALTARQRAALLGVGAILAAHFALFLGGLARTSLTAAVALVSLEPLAVVLTAWLAFRLRPTPLEGVGLVVAASGAAIVGLGAGRGEHSLVGDVMVLGAVVLYGAYVAAARGLRDAMPVVPYAGAVYGVAGALLLPFALVTAAARPAAPHDWLAVLGMGLVPTLVGHTLIQRSARTLPPALVALVSPGETVGATLIGIARGERPSGAEWAGAAIVVLGATLAILGGRGAGGRRRS